VIGLTRCLIDTHIVTAYLSALIVRILEVRILEFRILEVRIFAEDAQVHGLIGFNTSRRLAFKDRRSCMQLMDLVLKAGCTSCHKSDLKHSSVPDHSLSVSRELRAKCTEPVLSLSTHH